VKVLIVTGIWPPDVGGPATHAPQVAAHLVGRGHAVDVLTTADSGPHAESYPVHTVARSLPTPLRHARVSAEVARLARRADVVYAASMVTRTAVGTALARTPLVIKLSGDVAYERALRRGSYSGSLDEFQHASGARLSLMRKIRTAALRRAEHVVCPSEFLSRLAIGWGVPPDRVSVLPNPAPELPELAQRDELRRRYGVEGPTLAFAGRLTAAKSLDVALTALAEVEGVSLLIAGDGEQRRALEERAHQLGLNGRARFLGRQPSLGVLELLYAASARSFVTVRTACWCRLAIQTRSLPRCDGSSRTSNCATGCGPPPRAPSTRIRQSACSSASRPFSCRPRETERAVRRSDALPAPTRAAVAAEVGRARGEDGASRSRAGGRVDRGGR
jgi:glycosyltransferase involved in cell wall biosynthesis